MYTYIESLLYRHLSVRGFDHYVETVELISNYAPPRDVKETIETAVSDGFMSIRTDRETQRKELHLTERGKMQWQRAKTEFLAHNERVFAMALKIQDLREQKAELYAEVNELRERLQNQNGDERAKLIERAEYWEMQFNVYLQLKTEEAVSHAKTRQELFIIKEGIMALKRLVELFELEGDEYSDQPEELGKVYLSNMALLWGAIRGLVEIKPQDAPEAD